MSDADLNERVTELEVKISFQQETIDSLNETVTRQWDQIEQLKRAIERFEGRLVEMSDMAGTEGNEPPPPHY
jgi:SlyX protein